jgi:GT2 family glycosyltransferase
VTEGRRVLPSVTVIIPNRDAADQLNDCLVSLTALDYPSDRLQILVVDNDSSDRSVKTAQVYGAEILELDHNHGFAGAINSGARSSTSDCIALLNNDMRVEPDWLTGLVDQFRPSNDVLCVSGAILDWGGTNVDFAGGVINFHGFGDQPLHGRPVSELPSDARIGEPFACGGSMLIDRELFLNVGGFDESYFAYFEDVDLGWRLNVLGHQIAFAPASRCLHRHHGTSRRMAPQQRTLLLERNALRSLIKNVDDANLARLLGPATLLLVARALDQSRSERWRFRPFARGRSSERIPADTLARLHAVGDVLEELPQLLERRALVQAARQVSDDEVFARFGAFAEPIGATSDAYRDAFANVSLLLGDVVEPRRDPMRELGGSRGRLSDAAARRPWLRRLVRRS